MPANGRWDLIRRLKVKEILTLQFYTRRTKIYAVLLLSTLQFTKTLNP